MRIQKRFEGKIRKQVSSRLAEKLDSAVEREAKRFDCSKSFVIAVCISESLSVPIEDSYK